MAKKKIIKLTDEQYYKYIMSLKNDSVIPKRNKQTEIDKNIPEEDNNK